MRISAWIVVSIQVLFTSALVIPQTNSSPNAFGGSIAHPNTPEAADHAISALQTEYEKLEALKYQFFTLHHEVLNQEHEIFVLINKDFKSCSGVKCYLQTTLRKAPDFFELFKTHFRHRPKNATDSAWDCPWTGKKAEAQELPLNVDADVVYDTPASPEDQPFHIDDDVSPPSPPGPEADTLYSDDGPSPQQLDASSRPFPAGSPGNNRPRPGWSPVNHNPTASAPPYHPEYQPWKENPSAPAAHPSPHHERPPSHPFHMPHPAPRNRHFKLILSTATFVVTVVILALLLTALKVYLANPRVQADRAARREECRTRREYRRAACQHRFRQLVSRFCPRGTDDYEEKQAMLQQADSVGTTQHLMGADINSLRRAHEIVGRLMRAGEGRMENDSPRQTPKEEEPPTASSSRSVRSLQTTTALPPYTPRPPGYSQELSRDTEVVDGFRFTPSQSDATVTSSASSFILDDADLCTESSVVDCRSRMSMETESINNSQTRETSRDRFRGNLD